MKHPRTLAHVVVLVPFLLGSGCVLGPDHARPQAIVPTTGKETAGDAERSTATPALPSKWWTIFGDAELNRVEETVLAANHDLQRAVARVTEARALARSAAAEFFPHLAERHT